MTWRRSKRGTEGFVALELVAGIALLLLPMLLLVATLPTWVERRHAAVVVAREAARAGALAFPDRPVERAESTAAATAERYGLEPSDVSISVDARTERGGLVVAVVTVRMPAVVIPGLGAIDAWEVRVTSTRRIDDYRSR